VAIVLEDHTNKTEAIIRALRRLIIAMAVIVKGWGLNLDLNQAELQKLARLYKALLVGSREIV
jgi:hypothetical protein